MLATHSDAGYLRVDVSELDGTPVLQTEETGIDLYRTGASFNRPKWGIYRSVQQRELLVNETDSVDFAQFTIQRIRLR